MFTGIVYAAGINSRMRGALDVPFKGMLPVYGSKTLIACQIERLFGIGCERVIIVLGMEHQLLEKHIRNLFPDDNILFATNPDYKRKANMLSLWHARKWCMNPVCFTTSDLFFDGQLPTSFAQMKDSQILADTNTIREEQTSDAVKLKIADGQILRVNKALKGEDISAFAPGFYFFNEIGINQILRDIEKQIDFGSDDQSLYWSIDRVAAKHKILPCFLTNPNWIDVDTEADLRQIYLKSTRPSNYLDSMA